MSACMPSSPKPVAKVPSYAADFDKAERASSETELSTIQIPLKTNTFSATSVKEESLSRSSTAVPPGTTFPLRNLKYFITSVFSAVINLWHCNLLQREDSEQVLRSFKRINVDDYPKGYPQLAAFITSDENLAIYRKFGRASNRVLLHLQSEIAALDQNLTEMDRSDASEGSTTAYRLNSIRHEASWDEGQRTIIMQLKKKLPIYYDLLLKNSQLKTLGSPLKHDHQSLFHWIEGKKPTVEEEDDWILHEDDLVALSYIDRLESSLTSSCLNRLFRPSKHGDGIIDTEVTYYSQKRISAAAKSLSVFIAVAILTVPVSVFLLVPLDRAWMSVTVLLSVLIFSTLLSLSTKIKAKDVLLGSAAYCAVLATFLGNLPTTGAPRLSSVPGQLNSSSISLGKPV